MPDKSIEPTSKLATYLVHGQVEFGIDGLKEIARQNGLLYVFTQLRIDGGLVVCDCTLNYADGRPNTTTTVRLGDVLKESPNFVVWRAWPERMLSICATRVVIEEYFGEQIEEARKRLAS